MEVPRQLFRDIDGGFPYRRLPSRSVFSYIHQRLGETESFQTSSGEFVVNKASPRQEGALQTAQSTHTETVQRIPVK
jgi:hypothetical protein